MRLNVRLSEKEEAMAINDHLKIASAEIMKAVELLKQEITDLRGQDANLQKVVNRDIALLTSQLQMREQEVKSAGDSNIQSQSQAAINLLIRQIADAKSQLGKDQKRIQDLIREKESLINSYNQQAKSIQL
jgi:hypothetical protein